MRLKEHVATALADLMTAKLKLGQPVTVIDEPPSAAAEYPAVAVQLERERLVLSQSAPVLADADGTPLTGSDATSDDGEILDGDPIMIGPGTYASSAGTLRCSGRIWAGCRYVGKREELEEKIRNLFLQDDSRPGTLLFDLAGAQIEEFTIPFGTAAVTITDATWDREKTFEARLWAWRMFDLDIPLLVPRTDPMVAHLILEFSQNITAVVDDPADPIQLPDLEKWMFDDDGVLVPTDL
jgi:hypothetical protein